MNGATEQVLILNCHLSFFLSVPILFPPPPSPFVPQHPFPLNLLEMLHDCTCPLVATKQICCIDGSTVCETQFRKETLRMQWGVAGVAAATQKGVFVVLEMLEGGYLWLLRSEMDFESSIYQVVGSTLLLFWFRVLGFKLMLLSVSLFILVLHAR
jgi:hypothetical protein